MSSRQERRKRRQEAQQKREIGPVPQTLSNVSFLNWFRQQSWDKKVPVLGVFVALFALLSFWLWNLTPVVIRMLTPKPEVHIGVAFYAYERGWTLEGKKMQTFSELRNLSSNCYFWQVPPRPLGKDTKLIGVHSWVQTKFRFQNMSDERITNLRMSIASPLQNSTTVVSHTPNVEAKGKFDTTYNETRNAYVINIEAIPPKQSAIVSLETPMDKGLYRFLYDGHGKFSMPVVSFASDQFSNPNPPVDKVNGLTMYALETEMRTGDKNISMNEKIEIRMLGPSESEPSDVSDRLLPNPSHCKKGTAGNW